MPTTTCLCLRSFAAKICLRKNVQVKVHNRNSEQREQGSYIGLCNKREGIMYITLTFQCIWLSIITTPFPTNFFLLFHLKMFPLFPKTFLKLNDWLFLSLLYLKMFPVSHTMFPIYLNNLKLFKSKHEQRFLKSWNYEHLSQIWTKTGTKIS